MAQGYAGRYLSVDLTAGHCTDFVVDDQLRRKFIGAVDWNQPEVVEFLGKL